MERKIALYMRLSKEDEFCHVESNSISMQRILLNNHAGEIFPGSSVVEFIDDGYSGTNFERPGIQELLSAVKDGMIGCIIVKDFSRFAGTILSWGPTWSRFFRLWE